MDDKEFRKWNKIQKAKKVKKPKYKIITKRKYIWKIPDNF